MLKFINIKNGLSGKAKNLEHFAKLQALSGGKLKVVGEEKEISEESKNVVAKATSDASSNGKTNASSNDKK